MYAANGSERVSIGKNACAGVPHPAIGKIRNFAANNTIKNDPVTNDGTLIPMRAINCVPASSHDPGFNPPTSPAIVPMINAIAIAPNPIVAEIGNPAPMISFTVQSGLRMLGPRSNGASFHPITQPMPVIRAT